MAEADLILVTSGTATLEAMLFMRLMVIVYRTGDYANIPPVLSTSGD